LSLTAIFASSSPQNQEKPPRHYDLRVQIRFFKATATRSIQHSDRRSFVSDKRIVFSLFTLETTVKFSTGLSVEIASVAAALSALDHRVCFHAGVSGPPSSVTSPS